MDIEDTHEHRQLYGLAVEKLIFKSLFESHNLAVSACHDDILGIAFELPFGRTEKVYDQQVEDTAYGRRGYGDSQRPDPQPQRDVDQEQYYYQYNQYIGTFVVYFDSHLIIDVMLTLRYKVILIFFISTITGLFLWFFMPSLH